MFKLFKHKKGVSPLVATIFLMALAVGVGAVIMQFSEDLVGTETVAACSEDFTLVITKVCMRTASTFEFTAENTGDYDMAGLRIEVQGMGGQGTIREYPEIIAENGKMKKKINFPVKLQAVQFVPLVKQNEEIHRCNNRLRIFTKDDIKGC
tara:strand:- start:7363 stop:7815 length:453 start_codon:yes stop_codon:yes gene_type:complete